jgi:hypothetical protein
MQIAKNGDANIMGIDAMTPDEIAFELNRGGKFVVYRYCVSAILITLTLNSDIYLIRAGQSRIVRGLPWTLVTLLAGWWGVPWGPIRTIQSLWSNLHGGTNVSSQVANAMQLKGLNWVALCDS